MNIWKQLKLEPTDDKRLIKRAYAKQLKQCKPDEKPEEFQALHEAYQRALSLAEYAKQEDQTKQQEAKQEEDRQEQVTNELKVEQEGSEKIELEFDLEAQPENQDDQEPAFSVELEDETEGEAVIVADIAHQQTQFNAYLDDFVNYIQTQGKYPKNKSWQVFLDSEFLDEPQLKQTTSYQVFDTVISLCTKKQEKKNSDNQTIYKLRPVIDEILLLALSERFNWLDQRIELEDIFDLNAVDYLLDLIVQCQKEEEKRRYAESLNIKPKHKQSSSWMLKQKRFIAFFIIDASILLFISGIVIMIVGKNSPNYPLIITYFVYFSLLESNLLGLSASVGKWLMGLKVVKVNSLYPLPIHQAIWRTALTLPFIGLAKFTAFITLFISRRNFLNDNLSGSYVIEADSSFISRLFERHK